VAVDILTPLLGVLHAASFLELNWDGRVSAGDALVGAGTLLLAGTTAWLARRTRQDVERNREGVEIAARGLEMHDWPFLVATPDRPTFVFSGVYDRDTGEPSGDPEWRCDVNVANHGRGPAIFDGVSLKGEGDQELVGTDWEVESTAASSPCASYTDRRPGSGMKPPTASRWRAPIARSASTSSNRRPRAGTTHWRGVELSGPKEVDAL